MLVVVPYLVQHPGSRLGDVATLFGMAPEQLRRDLDLLFMSGLPPYGPGDLIDVDVDEDDRIWITMADHFARPLRLTRSEALALYVRGTELVATPGLPQAPDLASALAKLRETLGPDTLDADGLIEVMGGGVAPQHLALLREAAETRHRVEIEYFSASSGAWSTRAIEPEAVFSSLGNWYVVAWDPSADAERLFRADRVRSAVVTRETFEPHGLAGAGRDLYTPGADDVPVRIRLHADARWIAEYYATTDAVELDDGSLEVTLPARSLGWIAKLLLRVGPDAEIVAPAALRDELRALAERTRERYRG